MKRYGFDCTLTAAIRVEAESEEEARKMLSDALDCADVNFGAWPNGDPILAEASLDRPDPRLFEVGEPIERQSVRRFEWYRVFSCGSKSVLCLFLGAQCPAIVECGAAL